MKSIRGSAHSIHRHGITGSSKTHKGTGDTRRGRSSNVSGIGGVCGSVALPKLRKPPLLTLIHLLNNMNCRAMQIVLERAFALLGLKAPERM
jgi:hypothetical protein